MKVSLSSGDLDDLRNKFRECVKTPKMIDGKWVIEKTREGYDPDGCEYNEAYLRCLDPKNRRIMTRHCIEFEYNVFCPYCKNCRDFLPQQSAIKSMRERMDGDFYNLDLSTPEGKLMKEHIDPEKFDSKGEVDSYFYSIIPKDRLEIDPLTLGAMAKYCKEVFEDKERLTFGKWVIESGKHEDRPNPHIHAVVKFRGKPKNFARHMKTRWKKIFPDENHTIDFTRYSKKMKRNVKGIDMYPCMNKVITGDKIKYLDNGYKNEFGDDHTNFIDLGINGELSS